MHTWKFYLIFAVHHLFFTVKKISLLFTLFTSAICFAQLKSPQDYLGYPIGERYTPHYKLVSYFQYVADNAGTMVKLQQYGETNEHRPLYLTFISSAENISNLENIRLNNLRLAQLAKDKMMPAENTPVIVWLSYNVHGNETSSSEAAMLTLFSLVNPDNTQTKEWLKNTVVVIDPCLNPDGRERYINWFNTMTGENYNPSLLAREHDEPWPGGRTNHYNFDLNRDWCWQTQKESIARVAAYSEWMPQVHVDFHEQGINDNYYFAPAAQPYHEVITKWQRDFQSVIGKNNAKYFDRNNWLYFTKEIFDLLYPSYGDSYPLFNGSIGMTYEQAGGPAGGLGVIINTGDTLSLFDRAYHHFTSSISTIEATSQHAGELIKEFHAYFNNAVNGGVGEFKSYIIKNNSPDAERIAALKKFLDKNGILYATGSGNGKGYSYLSKKEETFTANIGDVIITTNQPKASLVKVLFEPQTKLVDSITYDITAWSVPYIFGLTAYASKSAITTTGNSLVNAIYNDAADVYGYAIRWQGTTSVKVISQLLQNNIKLRFSHVPFELNGQQFDRGTIIILKNGNERWGANLWKQVASVCNNNIRMYPLNSGMVDKGVDFGSSYIHLLQAPRVALLTGEQANPYGAGEVWHLFDKEINYPITLINASEASSLNWDKIDVLIMPNGRYKFLSDKEATDRFRQWIEKGGRVIAMEAAVAQLSKFDWCAVHAKNNADSNNAGKDNYQLLQNYEGRERESVASGTPGAIFKVDIDNTHPLMFGYPSYYYTLKMDDNVYDFIKEGGWNAGVIKKDNQVAGYVGYKLNPTLKDGLVFGVQDLGNGNITFLGDDVLFRDFWENGKLMFCNAVFFVGQ